MYKTNRTGVLKSFLKFSCVTRVLYILQIFLKSRNTKKNNAGPQVFCVGKENDSTFANILRVHVIEPKKYKNSFGKRKNVFIDHFTAYFNTCRIYIVEWRKAHPRGNRFVCENEEKRSWHYKAEKVIWGRWEFVKWTRRT